MENASSFHEMEYAAKQTKTPRAHKQGRFQLPKNTFPVSATTTRVTISDLEQSNTGAQSTNHTDRFSKAKL